MTASFPSTPSPPGERRLRRLTGAAAAVVVAVAVVVAALALSGRPRHAGAPRNLGAAGTTVVPGPVDAGTTVPAPSPTTAAPATSAPSTSTTAATVLPTVWTARRVPSGATSPLVAVACPSATSCYAVGGRDPHPGEVVATADGGATWQLSYTGRPGDAFGTVACPSTAVCIAAGATDAPPGSPAPTDGLAVATRDGGRHWAPLALPARLHYVTGVACTTAATCVVVGSDETNPSSVGAVVARTVDGAASWSLVTPPRGLDPQTVACRASGLCLIGGQDDNATCCSSALAARSTDGGATWSRPVTAGRTSLGAVTCIDDSTCVGVGGTSGTDTWGEGALLLSTDGGRTWSTRATGSGNDVSCTATFCLAVGASYDPATKTFPSTAFVSTDAGRTWRAGAPRSPREGLGAVACPTPAACVAVGGFQSAQILTFTT